MFFESLTLNLWWNVNESFQILSIWVKNIDFPMGYFACFPMEGLFSGLLPSKHATGHSSPAGNCAPVSYHLCNNNSTILSLGMTACLVNHNGHLNPFFFFFLKWHSQYFISDTNDSVQCMFWVSKFLQSNTIFSMADLQHLLWHCKVQRLQCRIHYTSMYIY